MAGLSLWINYWSFYISFNRFCLNLYILTPPFALVQGLILTVATVATKYFLRDCHCLCPPLIQVCELSLCSLLAHKKKTWNKEREIIFITTSWSTEHVSRETSPSPLLGNRSISPGMNRPKCYLKKKRRSNILSPF